MNDNTRKISMNTILTSDKKWLQALASAYKAETPVLIVDDADIGIDPRSDTILQMGKKASLGVKEWIAVVISLGVAAIGAYVLVMAVLDPEPFSRIAFTLGTGALLTLGGGGTAVRILTKVKPPKVSVTAAGFEISWE
jgi:hypothetical protein